MRRRPPGPGELRTGDSPERNDEALRGIEAAARRMFAGSVVAREGLTLSP